MGDRYQLKLICPYCLDETEAYYAESCECTSDKCENCGKEFDIAIVFKAVKKKK